jgi:hypothetical protein|tara:strand:- start:99 stop:320 length:222 start_codon:yes stop_codon:yes gene_type:complete
MKRGDLARVVLPAGGQSAGVLIPPYLGEMVVIVTRKDGPIAPPWYEVCIADTQTGQQQLRLMRGDYLELLNAL